MNHDRLGRRRHPNQQRGLKPLHPPLPQTWLSRALRVAMSESDWARFEARVQQHAAQTPTHARAVGETIAQLLDDAPPQSDAPAPLDWLDWERRKSLRLLPSQAH